MFSDEPRKNPRSMIQSKEKIEMGNLQAEMGVADRKSSMTMKISNRLMHQDLSQSKLNMAHFRKSASLTKIEKTIADKIAYEWKNLYRMFTAMDSIKSGLVTIKQFDETCL